MTKTAKVEAVKTEAESTVKSLFRVVDARAKAEGYVASARETVQNLADKAVSGAAKVRTGADQAVDVVAAGANAGVKGVASLGHHVVDATYANLTTTADMVKGYHHPDVCWGNKGYLSSAKRIETIHPSAGGSIPATAPRTRGLARGTSRA